MSSKANRQSGKAATYHHGDLRNALLEAAVRQLARTGAHALSVREVARNAGVSHTASYRHFPDKESLLAAIAEQGFVRLRAEMDGAVRGEIEDPLARLQASGVAYVRFGVAHPQHLEIMFGGLIAHRDRFPALQDAAQASYGLLLAIVHDAIGQGRIRAESPQLVALTAWSLVHGLAQLLARQQIPLDAPAAIAPAALAQRVTALLVGGLEARPAAAGS